MCECQGNPLARVNLALGLPCLLANRALDRKYLVRLEYSENLDTPREAALVLVFANLRKCRSIRKLKLPEIQTKIFLQMESAIGLSLARAFLIVFLVTISVAILSGI